MASLQVLQVVVNDEMLRLVPSATGKLDRRRPHGLTWKQPHILLACTCRTCVSECLKSRAPIIQLHDVRLPGAVSQAVPLRFLKTIEGQKFAACKQPVKRICVADRSCASLPGFAHTEASFGALELEAGGREGRKVQTVLAANSHRKSCAPILFLVHEHLQVYASFH